MISIESTTISLKSVQDIIFIKVRCDEKKETNSKIERNYRFVVSKYTTRNSYGTVCTVKSSSIFLQFHKKMLKWKRQSHQRRIQFWSWCMTHSVVVMECAIWKNECWVETSNTSSKTLWGGEEAMVILCTDDDGKKKNETKLILV